MRAATKAVRDRTWLSRLGKQGGPPGAGGATDEDLEDEAYWATVEEEQQGQRQTSPSPSSPINDAVYRPSNAEFAATHWGKRSGSALGQLNGMATELRKRDPSLTQAQAFARVYENHAALAKRERTKSRQRLGAR